MDIRDMTPTANQIYLACICWLLEKTQDPNLFYFLQKGGYMKCKKERMFFKFEICKKVPNFKKQVEAYILLCPLYITYLIPEEILGYEAEGEEHFNGVVYRGIPKEIWEYIIKWNKK